MNNQFCYWRFISCLDCLNESDGELWLFQFFDFGRKFWDSDGFDNELVLEDLVMCCVDGFFFYSCLL